MHHDDFTIKHAKPTDELSILVIEGIPKCGSAGERFGRLCNSETSWIFTLDILAPKWLNEGLEVNAIL